MIYLDNAATTFPKPEDVYSAVDFTQRNLAVNVGRGSYSVANKAMELVDETRYLLAQMVRIDNPNQVILTPSATVAANEIIGGLPWDAYKNVYITPFEHNAIARPVERIKKMHGISVTELPFDATTHEFDSARAKTMFSKLAPDYVFINQVSNVTGTVVPVKEICSLAKEFDATTIVDASQSMGLIDIDMLKDKIDYLVFAGHKNLYASWGVGGFISAGEPQLSSFLTGGTGSNSLDLSMGNILPTRYEPASPNIIAIASLNASIKWLNQVTIAEISRKKESLCQKLISELKALDCVTYLPTSRQSHTSVVSFNVDGYTAHDVGTILSEDFDIAVRTGYHCAPYIHDFLKTKSFGGTVRVSVGYFNDESDIISLISAVKDL